MFIFLFCVQEGALLVPDMEGRSRLLESMEQRVPWVYMVGKDSMRVMWLDSRVRQANSQIPHSTACQLYNLRQLYFPPSTEPHFPLLQNEHNISQDCCED